MRDKTKPVPVLAQLTVAKKLLFGQQLQLTTKQTGTKMSNTVILDFETIIFIFIVFLHI